MIGYRHMDEPKKPGVDRRSFLTGAATGAAAALIAQQTSIAAAQTATTAEPDVQASGGGRPASDFMVDIFKSLDMEYMFSMCASSFMGIHESVLNYAGNKSPQSITYTHEKISVAMANGYAKIQGKPVLVCAHATVGAQHATMALYDAWADRVPIYLVLGNTNDAVDRQGEVFWLHSAQDPCALVRDFTKWDDNPASLTHFAESAVRAYKIAMTPPMGPVAIVVDEEMQHEVTPSDARIPTLNVPTPPAADSGAIAEIAKLLVAAENPVILASRAARTPAGLALMVELAETLQAGVVDQWRRMNFPTRHPLNQSLRNRAAVADADVILGLEIYDFYGVVHTLGGQTQVLPRSITKPGAKLISINSSDLFFKSNYQNVQRYQEVDLSLAADAEATLPALIEAVKRLLTDDRRRAIQARGAKLAEASRQILEQTHVDASYAWDASPISTARLSSELWGQIKNEDWSLVSDTFWVSNWPLRLWNFDKHHQFIGGAGGEGVGYLAPAAVGAALANKKHGRLSVSIQTDGDLMYGNGVLWTAAHHRIPLLTVMHNNRAYHQEIMQLQRVANQHNRGAEVERSKIGTCIEDPNINYAMLAQSMGVRAEGPISDPKDLGPAIRRGIEVVKRGDPYLIDVITQPR